MSPYQTIRPDLAVALVDQVARHQRGTAEAFLRLPEGLVGRRPVGDFADEDRDELLSVAQELAEGELEGKLATRRVPAHGGQAAHAGSVGRRHRPRRLRVSGDQRRDRLADQGGHRRARREPPRPGWRRAACRRRRRSGSRPERTPPGCGTAARSPRAPAARSGARGGSAPRGARAPGSGRAARDCRAGCSSAPPPSSRGSRCPRRDSRRRSGRGCRCRVPSAGRARRRRRDCCVASLRQHDVPGTSGERALEFLARRDPLEGGFEASATQLLVEETGVGRRVVHHESPNRHAHECAVIIGTVSVLRT